MRQCVMSHKNTKHKTEKAKQASRRGAAATQPIRLESPQSRHRGTGKLGVFHLQVSSVGVGECMWFGRRGEEKEEEGQEEEEEEEEGK